MTRIRTRPVKYQSRTVYSTGGTTTFNGAGSEMMEDELHDVRELGEHGDAGGPMTQVKRTASGGVPMTIYWPEAGRSVSTVQYAHKASFGTSDFPASTPASTASLWALGTTAIARCEPTNPTSGVLTALGELRAEGIPQMLGSGFLKEKTRIARNSGNEYLNYQFGWAPLMSDLKSFANSVKRSDKILRQFHRDSGKHIRRRYEFPIEESASESLIGTNYYGSPTLTSNYYTPFHVSTDQYKYKVTKVTRRRWFSGAFTYYVPEPTGLLNKFAYHAQEADKLFGVLLTPEVIWNLTPWSWATDWFFNMGDVLHNLSAVLSDGLVMHYGYMMEETIASDIYILRNQKYRNRSTTDLIQTFQTINRSRVPANPFGFGLTNTDLSARQLAIIGALGLTARKTVN
jgi:hypothetical protein